jgi:hypothetical protein
LNPVDDLKIGVRIFRMIPKCGRPATSRNADTIANVHEMGTRDSRLTLGIISDELNINNDTILQILHEDLRKRKICAMFVPHSLRNERSDGDSHHAKTSSRLLRTFPVFLNALQLGMSYGYFNMTKR